MTKWTKKRIEKATIVVMVFIGIMVVIKLFFDANVTGLLIGGLIIFVLYIGREIDRHEFWDIDDEREESLKKNKKFDD